MITLQQLKCTMIAYIKHYKALKELEQYKLADYCREHDIEHGLCHYWYKKYRENVELDFFWESGIELPKSVMGVSMYISGTPHTIHYEPKLLLSGMKLRLHALNKLVRKNGGSKTSYYIYKLYINLL